ncbi:MAG TPA: glycosyl hydrolase [Streptosporangiaceae bacterium]
MKSRLLTVLAVAIAAVAVLFAGARFFSAPGPPPPAHARLPAIPASYLGVWEGGAPPSATSIADFTQAAGHPPNRVGYFSGWAERFQASYATSVRRRGMVPFVQIDPSFASVAGIAAGAYDGYLRSYADSVRAYGDGVVIGFGHEMNAPWYSWGYGHVAPATFVAAWQHIVTLFRGQGADNVTWLWTINADVPGTGPIAEWWPGAGYVNWIGIDGFYYTPSDTFTTVFAKTIDEVRVFAHKPILLSETAVGPKAGQFLGINDMFRGMRQFQTLGLVWFDVRQNDGVHHQDWRIEDSGLAAHAALKLGVSGLHLSHT